MSVYQVLVVDDSAFMRKIITDLIEQDPAFKVVATASNGEEAIEKARLHHPDLITMDVEMPVLNGLDALKVIVNDTRIPIIMLSGINEFGLRETIMALEAGAFDFIRKPSVHLGQDIHEVGLELRNQMKEAMLMRERRAERAIRNSSLAEKVVQHHENQSQVTPSAVQQAESIISYPSQSEPAKKHVHEVVRERKPVTKATHTDALKSTKQIQYPIRHKNKDVNTDPLNQEQRYLRDIIKKELEGSDEVQVISKPLQSIKPAREMIKKDPEVSTGNEIIQQLVAIGCSTGGPKALKSLLSQIPGDFPAPIVIVQHMPPDFTKSLANRIDSFSDIKVKEAEQGMKLEAGTAYIAPGGYHMKVSRTGSCYEIVLNQEESVNGHRPSVDTLFESLLPHTALQKHIVLLTGMGSDGARMMKRLYDAGVTSTFAENEESCVVYGMPRAAVELECVQHVLSLEQLTSKLIQAVMEQA